MQALPYVLVAASTAVSAVSTIQQGKAQRKAAEYNAQVNEQNAIAAKNKAKYDESIHRERIKRLLSSQKAAIGASGLNLSGSPLLATLDTAEKGELDALAIRYGGTVAANKYKSAAGAYRMKGKSAQTTSYYNAGTTLLSGANRAYNLHN